MLNKKKIFLFGFLFIPADNGKRRKRNSTPGADDNTESIDPKSIIAMPDHIIESIFESLDLADRKNLSET